MGIISLARSAKFYARKLGWPILPLEPGSKTPFLKKRNGSRGVYDATTDLVDIEKWWSREPECNVGMHTVVCWALDVDKHGGKDGFATLDDLQRKHGRLPPCPIQWTGGGGMQLFFRGDERVRNRVNANKLAGLDVRSKGGYVVLPPSIHPDTQRRYRWAVPPHLVPVPEAPEWLIDAIAIREPTPPPPRRPIVATTALRLSRFAAAALKGERDALLSAGKGRRNHQLFQSACRLFELVAAGMLPSAEIETLLVQCAQAIGLEARETTKTIASGKAHGYANPRQVDGYYAA